MSAEASGKLACEIGAWVERQVALGSRVSSSKAIHDQVLGTHIFEPYEIELLNTHLLQRLRYISQTGFVYLTFPGARHSRFEHTIGTAILVERYARALNRATAHIDDNDCTEIRLAALLHDCGHAFFSHSSEEVYQHLPIMREIKNAPHFSDKRAGEIVSHAIITSAPFKVFFADLCRRYSIDPSLDRIADYIVGKAAEPSKAFLAEIISGPFDVDKLDYIHRDAHGTGLRLVVDLDRFFYGITVAEINGKMRLAIRSVEPLEQLLFSKMLLFSTVYHHHKVKACDCLLRGALAWAERHGRQVGGVKLAGIEDFLSLTDIDVLVDVDNPLIGRLRNRDLLYRAALISPETLKGSSPMEFPPGEYELKQIVRDPILGAELNLQIHEALPSRLKGNVMPEEIWVDIPETPSLKELAQARIVRPNGTVEAESYFPTEGWLTAYSIYRGKRHVFAPRSVVREVFEATQLVLRKRFDLVFHADKVESLCRLNV